jgi:hypothetical protein
MLNASEKLEPIHLHNTDALNGFPEEDQQMLIEQGFDSLDLPLLKRKGAETNEYYVYSSESEFKTITAETATLAMASSEIPLPLRIIHAHCRIKDIVESERLEFIEKPEPIIEVPEAPQAQSSAPSASTENNTAAAAPPTEAAAEPAPATENTTPPSADAAPEEPKPTA